MNSLKISRRLPLVLAAASSLVLVSGALTACAPVVLAGAGAAGYVGLQDRPVKQTAEDVKIKIGIKDFLTNKKFNYLTDVGIEVYYGDVLITGVVPTREDGETVLDIARRTEGVKRVYNELFVGAVYPAGQKARDAWISAQINTRLLANKNTYPLNYLMSVVNNHVYIMGSVQTSEEQRHALHILRTTQGVSQVHDYLTIAGTPNAPQTLNATKNANKPAANWQAPNPIPDDR